MVIDERYQKRVAHLKEALELAYSGLRGKVTNFEDLEESVALLSALDLVRYMDAELVLYGLSDYVPDELR